MIYAYAFAELLPEDTLRKYKFYENNNILISALLEIDDNFDQVYKLLNSLKIENINQRQKEFHDSYEYFYEKKYGEKIYTNTNLMLYFYNTLVQNSEEKRIIEEYLKENEIDNVYRIIPKGYFSKEYKKANPYITIIYFSENKLNVFEVK